MAKDSSTTPTGPTQPPAPPKKQTETELLNDVDVVLQELHKQLDTGVIEDAIMKYVKQQIVTARTGIQQKLRNIKIDAEIEAKRVAEEEANKLKGLI